MRNKGIEGTLTYLDKEYIRLLNIDGREEMNKLAITTNLKHKENKKQLLLNIFKSPIHKQTLISKEVLETRDNAICVKCRGLTLHRIYEGKAYCIKCNDFNGIKLGIKT